MNLSKDATTRPTLDRRFLLTILAICITAYPMVRAAAQDESAASATDTAGIPRNKVIKTISVGGNPYAIVVSRNNKFIYVTDPLGGLVTKISSKTNKVVKQFSVPGAYALAISKNGTQLYISTYAEQGITVLNANSGAVVQNFAVGGDPRYVTMTPNGEQVWVADANSAKIWVIDTATKALSSVGDGLGIDPTCVAFSPDGSTAYAADLNFQGIDIFDTASGSKTGFISTGYDVAWCVINPAGGNALYVDRPYVTGTTLTPAFMFTVIQGGSVQQIGTGELPSNFAVNKNGKYLYVPFAHATTTQLGNTVVMYDTSTLQPVGSPITVGNQPEFVVIAPSQKRAYVSNWDDGTISVINIQPAG